VTQENADCKSSSKTIVTSQVVSESTQKVAIISASTIQSQSFRPIYEAEDQKQKSYVAIRIVLVLTCSTYPCRREPEQGVFEGTGEMKGLATPMYQANARQQQCCVAKRV